MTVVSGDIAFEGFGAASAAFVSFTGARVYRIIRASSDRLDIFNIDVSWTVADPASAITVQCGPLMVWRCSSGIKDPPNIIPQSATPPAASSPMPAGFELLFMYRIAGQHPIGSQQPITVNQSSFRFQPGAISAFQGQQLFVACFQPIAVTNGAADIYAAGSASVVLSVTGIDYGLHQRVSEASNLRSYPKF